MKKTIIAHFYNEEYLLPYWLEYHKNKFDHGVMINHGSNDKSVEIIKNLVPNWEIVNSELEYFDAYLTDFEVQKIEENIAGWKICLNISEFLVGDLDKELNSCDVKEITIPAIIMTDIDNKEIRNDLLSEKPFGIEENQISIVLFDFYQLIYKFRFFGVLKLIFQILFLKLSQLILGKTFVKYTKYYLKRARLLHGQRIGQYLKGRHNWVFKSKRSKYLKILWYNYSPFTNKMVERKLDAKTRLLGLGNSKQDLQRLNENCKYNDEAHINKAQKLITSYYKFLKFILSKTLYNYNND